MSDIIEKVTKNDSVQVSKNIVLKLGALVDEIVSLYGEFTSSSDETIANSIKSNNIPRNIISRSANLTKLSKKYKPTKPTLKLDAIKAKLTSELIEKIFRKYAPKINFEDDIIIRKYWISKGSLHMNLISGGWKKWSTSDSGNICKFIAMAKNISNTEALEILAGEIGINTDFKTFSKGSLAQYAARQDSLRQDPKSQNFSSESSISDVASNTRSNSEFQTSPSAMVQVENGSKTKERNKNQKKEKSQKDMYEPYEIVPIDAKRFEPEKDLAFFIKYRKCKISDSYEYRDINGRLVGYVTRIIEEKLDKLTGKQRQVKQVMPVAYCKNHVKNQKGWKLKGLLLDGYKPFYRIEEVSKHPSKSVLIVEGEKTADAASLLFPDLVVISWLGGSQVIDKVNWSLLKDKEVIIWPDADTPGKKAANNIKDELLKLTGSINYNLVKIVDLAALDLSEKWDLADEIPSHLTLDDIHMAVRRLLIK